MKDGVSNKYLSSGGSYYCEYNSQEIQSDRIASHDIQQRCKPEFSPPEDNLLGKSEHGVICHKD